MKKLKLKLITLMILAFGSLALTGCGMRAYVEVAPTGMSRMTEYMYMTDEEVEQLGDADGQYIGKEEINGITYSKYLMEEGSAEPQEGTNGIMITATSFYYDTYAEQDNNTTVTTKQSAIGKAAEQPTVNSGGLEDLTGLQGLSFSEMYVTLPDEITVTNGVIQEDGKTVAFDMNKVNEKNSVIYAYTAGAPLVLTTKDELKLTGLNKKGHLTKSKTITVKSTTPVEYIKVNNKVQKSKNIKIKKQGKYKIEVKNKTNTKHFTVYYDKSKPTANVKNNKTYKDKIKITVKDKTSGIDTIKLDNKIITNKYVCKKKGTHKLVIEDKAGNKATIKFKIKK